MTGARTTWLDRAARRAARPKERVLERRESFSHATGQPELSRAAFLAHGVRTTISLPKPPVLPETSPEPDVISRRMAVRTIGAVAAIAGLFGAGARPARALSVGDCLSQCRIAHTRAVADASVTCFSNYLRTMKGVTIEFLWYPMFDAVAYHSCVAHALALDQVELNECMGKCFEACFPEECKPFRHVPVGGLTPQPIFLVYEGEPTGCGCVGSDTCCGCGLPFEEGGAGMCCIYVDCRCCPA
jgi:hypothetical protein